MQIADRKQLNLPSLLIVLALVLAFAGFAQAQPRADVNVRGENAWGIPCLREIGKAFFKSEFESVSLDIDWGAIPKGQDRAEYLLATGVWIAPEDKKERPSSYLVGQAKVAVIVHRNNPFKQITIAQIRQVLAQDGKGVKWSDIGGAGGVINCVGLGRWDISRSILRQTCMTEESAKSSSYLKFRDDFQELKAVEDIVTRVRADRNAIGLVLYTGQDFPSVRIVPVSADEGKTELVPKNWARV